MAFSPDGQILAAAGIDGTVWLWNVTDPARPARLSTLSTGPADLVTAVAFSPDGRTLAAAGKGDGAVWLWNLPSNVLAGPRREGVVSVAFSPDGRTLAAGSADGTVWLWNVTDPARPARLGRR